MHPTKIKEIIEAVSDPSALIHLADEFPDHIIGVVHGLPLQAQWILELIQKHPTKLERVYGALRHTKAFHSRRSVRFWIWSDRWADNICFTSFLFSVVTAICGFAVVVSDHSRLGAGLFFSGLFSAVCCLQVNGIVDNLEKKFMRDLYGETPLGVFLVHLFPKNLAAIVGVLAEVAPGEIPKLAQELPKRAIDIATWAPETVTEIAKALPSHAPALAAAFQNQALHIAELVPQKMSDIRRRVPDAFKLEESSLPRPAVVPLTPESTTLPRPAGDENNIAPNSRR